MENLLSQAPISKILRSRFNKIRERNPSYSLRAFASKLEMNSGALSEIILCKRSVSYDLAKRMAEKLELTDDEKKEFFSYFKLVEELDTPKTYHQIPIESYDSKNFWIVMAILNFARIEGFDLNAKTISESLRIEQSLAQNILECLLSENLLFVCPKGKISRSTSRISTSDGEANKHLQHIHKEYLSIAEDALLNAPLEERDITSMTIAIDSEKMPDARRLIRKFQDDFSVLIGSGNKNKVYTLNVQFVELKNHK